MLNTRRHVVVVDVETTGLDPNKHMCVEVAWWNLNTGHRGCFVPRHNVEMALAGADPEALRINNYLEKIAPRPQDVMRIGSYTLAINLQGNTLAGSKPEFDEGFLKPMFYENVRNATVAWHYRLWDLAPYAAGVLGLNYTPGLHRVCELLDCPVRPDHSAELDVTATGLCFLELFRRTGVLVEDVVPLREATSYIGPD